MLLIFLALRPTYQVMRGKIFQFHIKEPLNSISVTEALLSNDFFQYGCKWFSSVLLNDTEAQLVE